MPHGRRRRRQRAQVRLLPPTFTLTPSRAAAATPAPPPHLCAPAQPCPCAAGSPPASPAPRSGTRSQAGALSSFLFKFSPCFLSVLRGQPRAAAPPPPRLLPFPRSASDHPSRPPPGPGCSAQ